MGKYDSIINLDRPLDLEHAPMSLHNRAAQFAPFDALTGFGGRIFEAARITEARVELDDEKKLELNKQLQFLLEHIKERPEVTVTYFVPDETKDGGAYRTERHRVCKLDEHDEYIVLANGQRIAFDDILGLEFSL